MITILSRSGGPSRRRRRFGAGVPTWAESVLEKTPALWWRYAELSASFQDASGNGRVPTTYFGTWTPGTYRYNRVSPFVGTDATTIFMSADTNIGDGFASDSPHAAQIARAAWMNDLLVSGCTFELFGRLFSNTGAHRPARMFGIGDSLAMGNNHSFVNNKYAIRPYIVYRPAGTGAKTTYSPGTQGPNNNTWHQFALVWDPATMTARVTVDGVTLISVNIGVQLATDSSPFHHGSLVNNPSVQAEQNQMYPHDADELIVYPRALTNEELAASYTQALNGP